jgi:hypothetical protein
MLKPESTWCELAGPTTLPRTSALLFCSSITSTQQAQALGSASALNEHRISAWATGSPRIVTTSPRSLCRSVCLCTQSSGHRHWGAPAPSRTLHQCSTAGALAHSGSGPRHWVRHCRHKHRISKAPDRWLWRTRSEAGPLVRPAAPESRTNTPPQASSGERL